MSTFATRPSRPSTPAAAAAAEARFAERLASRRRTRWIRTGIGALIAVVVLALGWVVCFSSVFAVRSVQVAGIERLDAAQVERVARVPRGDSLALLDTASIEARIRTLAPVADVDVSRTFPNTVTISITERAPVAVLDTPAGRKLVDAEGVAYASAGESALKKFLVVTSTNPQLSAADLQQILTMLSALPEQLRDKVEKVEADTVQDMTVRLKDDRSIVWGGPDQPEFKTRVLDVLLRDKKTRDSRTFDVSVPEAPTTRR